MNNKQINKYEKWFKTHKPVCIICRNTTWHLPKVTIFERQPKPIFKMVKDPILQIICKCCGHIELVSGLISKIF